jgi:hypothetical protein
VNRVSVWFDAWVDVQDVAAERSLVDRFDEFARLVAVTQAEHLGKRYPAAIKQFEFISASDDDLAAAEAQLGTVLPDAYKHVMKRYGGGTSRKSAHTAYDDGLGRGGTLGAAP